MLAYGICECACIQKNSVESRTNTHTQKKNTYSNRSQANEPPHLWELGCVKYVLLAGRAVAQMPGSSIRTRASMRLCNLFIDIKWFRHGLDISLDSADINRAPQQQHQHPRSSSSRATCRARTITRVSSVCKPYRDEI